MLGIIYSVREKSKVRDGIKTLCKITVLVTPLVTPDRTILNALLVRVATLKRPGLLSPVIVMVPEFAAPANAPVPAIKRPMDDN